MSMNDFEWNWTTHELFWTILNDLQIIYFKNYAKCHKQTLEYFD